jgi:hypothetical protein
VCVVVGVKIFEMHSPHLMTSSSSLASLRWFFFVKVREEKGMAHMLPPFALLFLDQHHKNDDLQVAPFDCDAAKSFHHHDDAAAEVSRLCMCVCWHEWVMDRSPNDFLMPTHSLISIFGQ